jgi:3-oxoacyl-[acyl-carrier-protein] synthase II
MSDYTPVITGMGVVSAIGIGVDEFNRSLEAGKSGIDEIVSFDPEGTGRERAAEIHEYDEAPYLRSPKNYLDRNSALAFGACEMAIRQSGLELPRDDKRGGIAFGSAAGNLESLQTFNNKLVEKGPRFAPPFLFPHTYQNTTVGLLSMEYGLGGMHACPCSGGAAGLEAIAQAAQWIQEGREDLILAGGSEAFSEPLFHIMLGKGSLSPDNDAPESCLPLSPARNGTILGEGAAAFIIESAASAQARGAAILGKILGHGMAQSPADSMSLALRAASLESSDLAAIFAASGGYSDVDLSEAAAIRTAVGDHGTPVVALKGAIAETLGASGPLSLAAALTALHSGKLPHIMSENYGAVLGIDLVTQPRLFDVGPVMVNACSPWGGAWVSVVVGR